MGFLGRGTAGVLLASVMLASPCAFAAQPKQAVIVASAARIDAVPLAATIELPLA